MRICCCFSLIVCLTGCSSKAIISLGNGYEEIVQTRHNLSEPDSHRTRLQYRTPNGKKVLLWDGVRNEILRPGLLIFIGEMTSKQLDSDGRSLSEDRVFAATGPGPVVDITNEVLWRWVKGNPKEFSKVSKESSIVFITIESSNVMFHFVRRGGADLNIGIPLDELLDDVRGVQDKGKEKEEPTRHMKYIERLYPGEK